MKFLFFTFLIIILLLTFPLAYAEQPTDKSEKSFEAITGIDNFKKYPEATIMQMKRDVKFSGEWFMSLSQAKQKVLISSFIKTAKENGITIEKRPLFYLQELKIIYGDIESVPTQIDYPVDMMIKTIALIFGDYQVKGKAEQEVFKEFYTDEWNEMYSEALEVRKQLKGVDE